MTDESPQPIASRAAARESHSEAREAQRYDQLFVDHGKLQEENRGLNDRIEELLDRLNEQSRANDRLQASLIARFDGRLRMSESYEGVVEDVDGDRVLVIYDVEGRIVEQTYERSQFIDGRLPEVGTRLAVFVNVAEVPPAVEETEHHDEPGAGRREPLSGRVEF